MSIIGRLATVAILLCVFYFMFPSRAYAYLDPGSLNYILQLLMAALIGISLAIKIYWGRIKAFFDNPRSKRRKREEDNDR